MRKVENFENHETKAENENRDGEGKRIGEKKEKNWGENRRKEE